MKELLRHPGRAAAWLLVLVALAVAVVGFLAVKRSQTRPVTTTTEKTAVVAVSTAPAGLQQVQGTLQVTGTISAWDELNVGSEANGLRIEAVYVEEGDFVHKGELLARLNSSVLEAQLRQLQARLEQSRAAVAKARQPNRPQDVAALESALAQAEATIDQQRANLLQAEANLANAQTNAQRYTASLSEGFVTQQEAENRQTELERQQALVLAGRQQVEAARFAAEQARQRLELARAGGRVEDVSIAQSTTDEIAAQIQQVEAQIEQTRIVAPDDALVVKRQAHLGDIASAGKVLFTLVRQNRLELRALVPEVDLGQVREGMTALLQYDGKTVDGKVWQVSPTVDPTTRLGTVRIRVPSQSGLRPGMFVEGTLNLGRRQALTVPARAVLGEAGKYHVFLLEGDVVRRHPVQVGTRTEDRVVILDGLEPDQKVVVEGAGFVADGDTVTLHPPAGGAGGGQEGEGQP